MRQEVARILEHPLVVEFSFLAQLGKLFFDTIYEEVLPIIDHIFLDDEEVTLKCVHET